MYYENKSVITRTIHFFRMTNLLIIYNIYRLSNKLSFV